MTVKFLQIPNESRPDSESLGFPFDIEAGDYFS